MLVIPRWKFWLIILTCIAGIVLALPNALPSHVFDKMPSWLQNTINLGLELRGGSHLQLEVDLQAVARESLNQLVDDARSNLRKDKVGYTHLTVDKDSVIPALRFHLIKTDDAEKAIKVMKSIDKTLSVRIEDKTVYATYDEEAFENRKKALIDQSIEVIRRRVDETGTKEPIIQRQGSDRIILQLPGVDDPSEVRKRIGKTAKMTFHVVNEDMPAVPSNPQTPNAHAPLSRNSNVEYMREEGYDQYLPIQKKVMLSGETLVDARSTVSEGLPVVSISFNSLGSKKFAQISRDYLKKRFAIVLDNQVISAPVFNQVIPNGQAIISGHFTFKSAEELALLLRAGALPAPLKVLDERTIGPSLGSDSIKDGQRAVMIAFILVATFMTLSYAIFGLFANIALIFNIIFLFAGLSVLQATLTLPGIAGIALTIGMAVDANVLIYERIKEELRAGLKPVNAIEAGYKRAMMTIIDSNMTTLFGAFVLFEFGSGPIRGFAVTLALGILISLFTALSLSRLIIVSWIKSRKVTTLPI